MREVCSLFTTSATVAVLEAEGLVSRTPDERDGRKLRRLVLRIRRSLIDARSGAAEHIEVVTDLGARRIGREWRKVLRQRAENGGAEPGSLRSGGCVVPAASPSLWDESPPNGVHP